MPSEIRFTLVRKLLESHGWMFDRVTGSHHVFTKPGRRSIVVPVHHQKVAPQYVKEVEKAISQDQA